MKRKAAAALEAYDEKIRGSISSLTDSMNAELKSSGLSGVRSILEYPKNALENLISGFDLMVQDSRKSSIFSKGMGIQSAVLLSSFKWITLQHPDKNVLWLIEEPETFMHPKLAYQSAKILQQLSDLSTVIKTTHSLSFMPQSAHDVQGVQISPKGGTTLQSYKTLQEATESIRESLGVKFSDYFGLTDLNVFVEGETDIIYLEEIAAHYQNFIGRDILLSSGEVQYRDFGGVTGLKGFLRANYDLIRKEVVVVTLFDGDEAGRKSISELAGYHGKKGGFNGNFDYVVIPGRVEMEALFPDEWILQAHNENPEWFDLFIEDASGGASEFKIRDESKKAFMRLMIELVEDALDYSFLDKFLPVLDSIENALITRAKKLWPDRDFYKKWDIED